MVSSALSTSGQKDFCKSFWSSSDAHDACVGGGPRGTDKSRFICELRETQLVRTILLVTSTRLNATLLLIFWKLPPRVKPSLLR